MAISKIGTNSLDQSGDLELGATGNVGIGTASPTAKLDITKATNGNAFVVNAPGGETANFAVQGSGEQTFRLYNSAATGSTRTSIKLADRNNSDWSWIILTDTLGNGTIDLEVSSRTAGVFGAHQDGTFKFNSGFGSVGRAYGCRAWVNFNGTGTVAIRASGNVSSITDNGTGNYRVNFTNAMPDSNFCCDAATCGSNSTGASGNAQAIFPNTYTTSSVQVGVSDNNSDTLQDAVNVNVAIFR